VFGVIITCAAQFSPVSVHFPVYERLERRKEIICGILVTHKLLVLCLLYALLSGLHTVRVTLLRIRILRV
jgi:hypothetical protein